MAIITSSGCEYPGWLGWVQCLIGSILAQGQGIRETPLQRSPLPRCCLTFPFEGGEGRQRAPHPKPNELGGVVRYEQEPWMGLINLNAEMGLLPRRQVNCSNHAKTGMWWAWAFSLFI